MGFDTLIAALQKEKIDVVIAAMQATEDRKKMVDFSEVYHDIADALLVKKGSGITLKSVFDLCRLQGWRPDRYGFRKNGSRTTW